MRTSKGKAIYIKRQKLDQFRKGIKSMPCPRCQRVGWITANGPLTVTPQKTLRIASVADIALPVAEKTGNAVVHAPFASCFRMFSMDSASHLYPLVFFLVTSQGIFTPYRMAQNLRYLQPQFRISTFQTYDKHLFSLANLSMPHERSSPADSPDPSVQMLAHFTTVFPLSDNPFEAFQCHFQQSLWII